MSCNNYEIDLDELRPDLDGTKYLLSAMQDPYGTPYSVTIGRLVTQTGKDSRAISKAITRALEAAGYIMYPREAIAALQRRRSGGEVSISNKGLAPPRSAL